MVRRIGLLACLVAVTAAVPAEARRFRLFSLPRLHLSSGSGADAGRTEQRIEPVAMLPAIPMFDRDGEHYDLGYSYHVMRYDDGRVTDDRRDGGYILYHGERTARLSYVELKAIPKLLGYDPLQRHRASLETVTAPRTSTAPAMAASGGGTGRGIFTGLLIVLVGGVGGAAVLRAVFRRNAANDIAQAKRLDTATETSFDARVASRLTELNHRPPPPPVAARGFGRRAV